MARVLAGQPQWMADEPARQSRPRLPGSTCSHLRDQARSGKGVVAVLHDLHHAVRFADQGD